MSNVRDLLIQHRNPNARILSTGDLDTLDKTLADRIVATVEAAHDLGVYDGENESYKHTKTKGE